jgi:hypothetical protein
MKLSITTNFPAVQRKLEQLRADIGGRALASALNKTVDQAKTQMSREIVAEFNVKSAYVKDRLRVRPARFKAGALTLEASLIGGDGKRRSANIIAFVEQRVSLQEGRRRQKAGTLNQLFVKVKRTGQKKPLGAAFIGNKGRTVFVRQGKDRLPIKPVQVIDVAQMFNVRKINRAVVAGITQKFPAIFEREARFYLDRFNRSGL